MSNPALLTFPSDVPFRRQLQPPGARRHPGKLHLGFLAYLLTAHAPRGGRLLDPFAGSGGLLLATLSPWGCDVLLNELEPQWGGHGCAVWAHMQASPVQPRGNAAIWCGDSRYLPCSGLLPFDAIFTSPAYMDALSHQRHGTQGSLEREHAHDTRGGAASRDALRQGYAPGERNPAQIGNLAGARYWAAMQEVWAACVPCVRPGGVLVVVLKNIVRGNAEVDLIGGTRAQLEALGCRYVTTHYRAVAPGPFHRIRQKSRPDALVIDREGALVMEMPR